MSSLKIRPISTGRFMHAEKSNFTYGVDQGVKIRSTVIMFLIEGAKKKILVDTGGSDPEWASRYHHPMERSAKEDPLKAIESLGLKPTDIDLIINTHLHWDHCFNNHLFPNARILVQAEELRYAISPLPCHALYYESQADRHDAPMAEGPGSRRGDRRRDGSGSRGSNRFPPGTHPGISGRARRPGQWALSHSGRWLPPI